jgi:Zn-dependent metalloprotease
MRRSSCLPPIKYKSEVGEDFDLNSSDSLSPDESNSPEGSPIINKDSGPKTRSELINHGKYFFKGTLPIIYDDNYLLDSQENDIIMKSKYSGDVMVNCFKNLKKNDSYRLECIHKGYHIKIVDYHSNRLSEKYVYPINQLMRLPSVTADCEESDYNVDILYAIINFIDMLIEQDIPFGLKNIVVISGIDIANAYWNGSYLSIGMGCSSPRKSENMSPLVSCDIIGHELGHAVVEEICNLYYYKDSGALNESFADIFGVSLKYHIARKYKRRRLCIENTDATWGIGDEIMLNGMRDMHDPWSHQQPMKLYDRYYWTSPEDYYGVHTNSGIFNYYFFRLTQIRPFWESLKIMLEALKKAYQNITFKNFHQLLPDNLYIDIV